MSVVGSKHLKVITIIAGTIVAQLRYTLVQNELMQIM